MPKKNEEPLISEEEARQIEEQFQKLPKHLQNADGEWAEKYMRYLKSGNQKYYRELKRRGLLEKKAALKEAEAAEALPRYVQAFGGDVVLAEDQLVRDILLNYDPNEPYDWSEDPLES